MTTTGLITHPITASNGQIFSLSFSRPVLIPLSLHINLRLKAKLEELELAALKSKIIDYAYHNIKLGDDPYPSRLYPVLFSESKILDAISITLRRVGSLEPVPKDFKGYELASFDSAQVFIEQVVAP